MTGRLTISLPGCTVTGHTPDDGPIVGFFVEADGWEGWDDGVSGRRDALPRPSAHGEFDLPVTRGPRTVTLKGQAVARNAFELGRLRSAWTGIGADGDRFPITVDHQDETLSATARTIDARFKDTGNRGRRCRAEVSLELLCADPRKYGTITEVSGNTVTVANRGNFPASPVVTVAGPRSGYTITGPEGREYQVTQALAAGQTHRIDFRTGLLYRNGSPQLGAIGRAELWAIPPGRQISMAISSGSMTVSVADTFI